MLDILFDQRNKSYGAYLLRRNYNQRLAISLALALSSVMLLFFLLRTGESNEKTVSRPQEVVIRDLVVPARPKIPEPPALPGHEC